MKKFWKNHRWVSLWVIVVLLMASGCEKDTPERIPEPDQDPEYGTVYEYIQSLFYFVYYWNGEVERYILKTPPKSGDVETYFYSLLYDGNKVSASDKAAQCYDRWSFMETYLDYSGVLVEGKYKSFGYNLVQVPDPDYSIRVCLVYENSPMAAAGIERGYELLKLNGTDVMVLIGNGKIYDELDKETNRFVFADREGNVLPEMTISAAEVNINPILHQATYEVNGKKVGYIVYNTFIVASKAGITAALQEMKDVDEFVLDLRYNGGGSVAVAEAICEHLLPQSVGNDSIVFAKFVLSELTKQRLKWDDEVIQIKRNESAMNLPRMFVITTGGTASASEEVINDMKPFLDVITVGTSTHGKPVGMGVWFYPPYSDEEIDAGNIPDWAFAPITFRNDNKDGEGSYFLGIPATYTVYDDLYNLFGVDPVTLQGEACLQSILTYIETDIFPASVSGKSVDRMMPEILPLKGLQIHAGCR